MQPIQARG